MKTILMSIRPKWCHKIFTGEKTIELRKTAPKPPFKVLVYCTKAYLPWWKKDSTGFEHILNGKVIGEFICEKVDEISVHNDIVYSAGNLFADKLKNMCLTVDELRVYLGKKNRGYALGITAPKLHDKPRDISKFYTSLPDKVLDSGDYDCRMPGDVLCMDAPEGGDRCAECGFGGRKAVSRAPQSWQYIVAPEAP